MPERTLTWRFLQDGKSKTLKYKSTAPMSYPIITDLKMLEGFLRSIPAFRFIIKLFSRMVSHLFSQDEKINFGNGEIVNINLFSTGDVYDSSNSAANQVVNAILSNKDMFSQIDKYSIGIFDICRFMLYQYLLEFFSALICISKCLDARPNLVPRLNYSRDRQLEGEIIHQLNLEAHLGSSSENIKDCTNCGYGIREILSTFIAPVNQGIWALHQQKEAKMDVLFFCYTDNHIKTVLPLLRYLCAHPDAPFKFGMLIEDIYDSDFLAAVRVLNVPILYLSRMQYRNPPLREILLTYKEEIKKARLEIPPILINNKEINPNTILKIMFKELIFLLTHNTQRYFRIDSFLEHYSPRVVVICNEVLPPGRIVTHSCNKRGIKTAYIPHGAITLKSGYSQILNTKAFVDGPSDAEILRKLGTPENVIVETGRPENDDVVKRFIRKRSEVRSRIFKKFHLDPGKKLILLGTGDSLSGDIKHEFVESVIEAVAKRKDCELIIKLHPSEDDALHKEILKRLGLNLQIIKHYNIQELITASDLLIAHISTIQIEAAIIGIPSFNVDYYRDLDYYGIIKAGVCLPIRTLVELNQNIDKALYDIEFLSRFHTNRDNFLRSIFSQFDGRACTRITDELTNMMKN